jgi:hypothetical protein
VRQQAFVDGEQDLVLRVITATDLIETATVVIYLVANGVLPFTNVAEITAV